MRYKQLLCPTVLMLASVANFVQAAPSDTALGMDDVAVLLSMLPIEQRQAVLGDEKAFLTLARQEAQNRAVLAAARDNGLGDDPTVKTLMQRGADRVLADVYLNQVIRSNLPAGFPDDKTVREYFDKNQDKFAIGERIHLWQIYLPVDKDAKDADFEKVSRRASGLVLELRKGSDFAAAAAEQSKHEASRLNGGYLGLLRFDELLPEVRAAVKGMKEGEISFPVRSDSGIHIVKRGATVPAKTLTFADVEGEIRQLLVREAILQTRAAVLQKIESTYPVGVDEKLVEQWRRKLQEEPSTGAESKEGAKPAQKKKR
jgi:parvulin-like peptidyl-prolyl isomerase